MRLWLIVEVTIELEGGVSYPKEALKDGGLGYS